NFEHRILNAADYGAYTSRKRFFGIFAKKGLPIVFPEPTHSKNGEAALFDTLHKWKPVREVLDLEDEGKSIFDRKKPLSDKTLERIYAGLIKFVAGGKQAFMVKYNSMNQRGRYVAPSIEEPCPTVATQGRLALASVQFLSKQFSGSPDDKNVSIEAPAGTITTVDHHALVSARFLCSYNFNDTSRSIDAPCPTLLTKDRLALINVNFIANEYSGGGQLSSIESPNPAVLTNPKQKLVTCKYRHVDSELPSFFVWTENGLAIEVYKSDTPIMVKIKEFMAMFGLANITMRMLKISELSAIMGFPEDYVLIGTQADQKKFIGNAVEVTIARALCEALCNSKTVCRM
uniref:DNA cytosine methyltransferase n=1 Tax=Paramuribaculum intestinale TaxID=2094151 RepID=UPI0025A9AEED